MNKIDVGYINGDWTVISNKKIKKDKKWLIHCRCKCGNEVFMNAYRINPLNKRNTKCCRKCANAKSRKHNFSIKYLADEYINKKRSIYSISRENHCDSRAIVSHLARYNIPIRNLQERQDIYENKEVRNLEGRVFGKWKVGKKEILYKYMPYYKCTCECGFVSKIDGWSLLSGKSKGCMKCARWGGYGEISGRYWHSLYIRAIERELEFNISIKQAWRLFLRQKRKCALTGLLLEFKNSNVKRKMKSITNVASLDRIDSSKGYVSDNVQWIHKDINKMKQSFSQDYFKKMCILVSKESKT